MDKQTTLWSPDADSTDPNHRNALTFWFGTLI